MSLLYGTVEFAATLIENVVVISSVTNMSGHKHQGKKHLLWIWGLSFIMMILVSWLNAIQAFSFLTIAICFCFVAVITKVTSKSGILRRAVATVITYLVIHAVDYLILFVFGFFIEKPIDNFHSFSLLLTPGPIRCVYLLIDKLADAAIYSIARKGSSGLLRLKRRYCVMLLSISSVAYITMSLLLSMVFADSLYTMQAAIMLSWVFIVVCVFMVIGIFTMTMNYQQEKQTNALLHTTNELMAKNYQQFHANQQNFARQIHDFNHHLKVLQEFVKDEKAITYLDSLLSTSYKQISLCHSGNGVIDAIINCKIAEAKEFPLVFQYKVDIYKPIDIDPVDLCGVFANQIDNAFDACRLIEDESKRRINVKIWQPTENTVFLQVGNTVSADPFKDNDELTSTKTDDSRPHGLGIFNIRSIATKYQGELKNIYRDGQFISTVFLCYGELDTDSATT